MEPEEPVEPPPEEPDEPPPEPPSEDPEAGAAGASAALPEPAPEPPRKSVTYQPDPLSWKPAAVTCLENASA